MRSASDSLCSALIDATCVMRTSVVALFGVNAIIDCPSTRPAFIVAAGPVVQGMPDLFVTFNACHTTWGGGFVSLRSPPYRLSSLM